MMARRFEASKVESLKRIALRLFHKMDRPTLVGQVSLYLGVGLDITLDILQRLEEEGHVRPMTPEERIRIGDREERHYWTLLGKASLRLAGDD